MKLTHKNSYFLNPDHDIHWTELTPIQDIQNVQWEKK